MRNFVLWNFHLKKIVVLYAQYNMLIQVNQKKHLHSNNKYHVYCTYSSIDSSQLKCQKFTTPIHRLRNQFDCIEKVNEIVFY